MTEEKDDPAGGAHPKRAFIIRDLSVKHMEAALERLRERPPDGWEVGIAKFDEDLTRGRIFEEIVRPRIEASDVVVTLLDEPNANVAFEVGYARGFRAEGRDPQALILAVSVGQIPTWVTTEPPYKGMGVSKAAGLSVLRSLLENGEGAVFAELPTPGDDTLFLCPPGLTGEAYDEIAADVDGDWRRVESDAWSLADVHQQLEGVGRVVWVIAPTIPGEDSRDGIGNTLCAAVAGMARAVGLELVIFRSDQAREVADVAAGVQDFGDNKQLETLLRRLLPQAADADPTTQTGLDALWAHTRTRCSRLVSLFPARTQDLGQVYVELSVATGLGGWIGAGREREGSADPTVVVGEGSPARSSVVLGGFGAGQSNAAARFASPYLAERGRVPLRDVLRLEPVEAGEGERSPVTGLWVVLGDPGSGKSTATKHLAVDLADLRDRVRGGADPEPDEAELLADGEPPVAIHLSLAALAAADPRLRHPIEAIVADVRADRGAERCTDLESLLRDLGQRDGRLWILLDGYDELETEARATLRERLPGWIADLPGARFCITSRRASYEPVGADFRTVGIEPLSETQQDQLLGRWLGPEAAAEVRSTLNQTPSLAELAPNPLLLSLLAKVEEERREPARSGEIRPAAPPAALDALYDRAVDHLLRRGHGERTNPDWDVVSVRAILGSLSLLLQRDEREAWTEEELERAVWTATDPDLVSESTTDRVIDAGAPSLRQRLTGGWGSAEALLRDLDQNAGVLGTLDGDGQPWRYLHRSLREFLAAEELARRGSAACVEFAKELDDAPRWAEVFGFALGRLGRVGGSAVKEASLRASRIDLLTDLAAHAPAVMLRCLPEVEGLGLESSYELLLGPRDNRSLHEIYDQSKGERLQWDGDHLVRLVRGWRRDGHSEEDVADFLYSKVSDGLATEHLAHLYYALERLTEDVDRARFFGACKRWPCAVNHEDQSWKPVPPDGAATTLSFTMGSPPDVGHDFERPQHQVEFSRFRLADAPVTEAEYVAFDPDREVEVPDQPIVNVNWWEAWLYARWVGGRLPTEAEWECAARAGTDGLWSHGNEEKLLGKYAWFDRNSKGSRHPVRRKEANPWGLFDMHGNIWEWCGDWFGAYQGSRVLNPEGPADGAVRVQRGGAYWNDAVTCRSAYRFGVRPWFRDDGVGFRVVLPSS